MMVSYFSAKVWTGKKQGRRQRQKVCCVFLQSQLLIHLVIVLLYRWQKFKGDNTDSKRYQELTRSPSQKVPSNAFKIVIPPAACVGLQARIPGGMPPHHPPPPKKKHDSLSFFARLPPTHLSRLTCNYKLGLPPTPRPNILRGLSTPPR